jgi:tetratricopeptide (TPR) repeat protein/tRNA A-37 threonylcarbamoyl transferase component Bud32
MSQAEIGERTWIDERADRFERDWTRGGDKPRIEDFLEGETGPLRSALLRELLRVERELRLGAGEQPGAEEYLHRFPDDPDAVATAFGHEDRPEAGPARAPVSAAQGLLFGLLALQNNFIDRDALVSAFSSWVADKSLALGQILLDRGALSPGRHAAIEILVQEHLEQHGHDPERSLAVLKVVPDVRNQLEVAADLDLQGSLLYLGVAETAAGDGDPDETTDGWDDSGTADPEGRFQIIRLHDRGALGEVYVARDQQLHRIVALKRIKKAHGTEREKRARFVVEAEITGRLEHPGIVPVYGLGTFDDGRPFYAMRFIRGDNLKTAIEQFHIAESKNRDPGRRTLALHKLLRRFLDVCNAIDYAHSRGVLHRDLKPGNIMLGKFGETLVVDWGLAKSVGRPEGAPAQATLGERTLVPQSGSDLGATEAGTRLGTPAYMSPEQAAGKIDSLGPASDVYSLGATLYCLLTGRAPFIDTDVMELLPKVERGEFPPPRQLKPWIHPALAAICLKAMATDPARRYESPRKLTDDIEHWLADEPVSAWPDPLAERVRRWMRRQRTLVTAAAAALVAATIGLAAVLVVQARANGALNKANGQLAESVRREQKANDDLAAAAAQIQARFDLALEAIKTFHTGVAEDALLKNDNLQPVRDRLLKGAAEFYKRLEGQLSGQSDRGSRRALGQAYSQMAWLARKLGARDQAIASDRQALAVRRGLAEGADVDGEAKYEVGTSLIDLGDVLQESGRTDEARASYEEARTLLEDLTRVHPDAPRFLQNLGRSHGNTGLLLRRTGMPAEAMASLQASLAIFQKLADAHPAVAEFRRDLALGHNNIAALLDDSVNPKEALRSQQAALAIQQKLTDANPANPEAQLFLALSHHNIAFTLQKTGKPKEALASYEAARAIGQRLADANPAVIQYQSELARTHNHIGILLSETGKLKEALASYEAARAIRQKLAEANPANTDTQQHLAESHHNIAVVLEKTGKPKEALASFEAERAIRQRLADVNPVGEPQNNLAHSHNAIARLLSRTGKPKEALASFEAERAILQKLADADPANTQVHSDLGKNHNDSGHMLSETGKPAEALASFEAALAIQQKLADADPANTDAQQHLALSHNNIALMLKRTGKPEQALASYEAARAIRQRLADANSTVIQYQSELRTTHNDIGLLLSETGKPKEALASHEAARTILQKLADADPANTQLQSDLAKTHDDIGRLLSQTGQPNEALASYLAVLAIRRRLADACPAVTRFRHELAQTNILIGRLQTRTGKAAEAMASLRSALAIQQKLADANSNGTPFQNDLAMIHEDIGNLLRQTGKPAESLASLQAALAIKQRLADANPDNTGLQGNLAVTHNNVGGLLRDLGRPAEALASYRSALAIQQRLTDAHATDTQVQSSLALYHQHIGLMLNGMGQPEEALASYRAALAIQRRLADAHPNVTEFQDHLAVHQINLGIHLRETGKPAEALASLQEAQAILRSLVRTDSDSIRLQISLANAELETGEALRWTGRPAEAGASYERALAILTRLINAHPAFADHLQVFLVFGWKGLGATQQAAGQPAAAVASWRRAVANDEHARSSLGDTLFYLAGCHARLGGIAGVVGSGLPATAGPAELDQAMALLRRAARNGNGNVSGLRRDPDLDPLRARADFQAMVADFAFPDYPFSRHAEAGP